MTLLLIIYFLLLYYIISKGKFQNPIKLYIVFITIALILVSGLRHEGVGNDTYAVMLKYEGFDNISWKEIWDNFIPKYLSPSNGYKDPGEDVFNKILFNVIPDSRMYLFFVATVFLATLGLFVYKHANSLFSVLFTYSFYITLFYQYVPNSSLRQTMALAILLFAYRLLEEKRVFICILLIAVASTFHKSSLIALLIIPLSYVGAVRKAYIGSILLFIVVLFNYRWVGDVLGTSSEVYGDYLGNTFYSNRSKPYMVILLIAGLYIIGLLFSKKDRDIKKSRLYYYGTALTLCLVPLVWIDPSALRLISYFGVYMGLLVGNAYVKEAKAKQYLMVVIVVFLLKAVTSNDDYHFMWQEMRLHDRYGYIMPTRYNDRRCELTCYFA